MAPLNMDKIEYPPLLKKLVDSAVQNANKSPHVYRYDDDLKHYSTFLYIMCGKYCYESLYENLPIPSISTIGNILTCAEH